MRRETAHSIPKESFYVLRSLQTPRAGKTLARWLFAILLIFFTVLFFPWQQNIHGKGKITALSPGNRPQTVETSIAGRIGAWKIQEGQFVRKGDTIVLITEVKEKFLDPDLLERLEEQIAAKLQAIASKQQKSESLKKQIAALENGMKTKMDQARSKLEAERVRFQNNKNQYERNKKLFEAGNIPLTKFQDIDYKYQGSEADFVNAEIEIERVQAEYLDKINKAESDLNHNLAEQFESQAEVSKLRNEFANMTIRNEQYVIRAPQAGYVVRATQAGIGETLKEGDAVCTVLPLSTDVAVEMYIDARDVPLVSLGRKVRIQFDGFPALQFSGWPSVSVGTYGGKVEVIDYVNSHPGQFRILVIPDAGDEAWPKQIRMGSGTRGWVMLDSVPVWYELWRQLNGFPPSLYEEPGNGKGESKTHQNKTHEEDK
ncbi:MAG: HlyD family secretion protein [Cyclobacteriaceae bacterium]|nr:HlyD family secretion protein [Cyclobacteriaceae bacterium]